MAEPAPTRRSSRLSTPPAQASSETVGVSRAELRRRAAASSAELTAVVLGTPDDEKRKDAADETVAVVELADLPSAPAPTLAAVEVPAPADAPLSRRARRTPAVQQPVEPFELLEPVVEEPATEVAAAEVEVLEVIEEPVAPAPAVEAAVASGFARRQRSAPRPIVEVDAAPVAPAEEAAPVEQVADAASDVDEFEAAARLFSFTGELAVQRADDAVVDDAVPDDAPTDAAPVATSHRAPRKARTSRASAFKRVTAASFSVGVMGIVGLMTVGMTTPAEAVAAASGVDASMSIVAPGDVSGSEVDAEEIQAYVAPATVEAEALDDRAGSYETTTVAELASQAGIRNFSNLFHNDPNAAIQWPFVVGVTMSYGFGMRDGKLHKGIDFTPGAGSPIQAIADGTVRVASEAGGDYGVHVIIDHVIDGQLISSHYAHMQYGSLQVVPGQKVTVGTVLGHTGNTGRSYGAHTHFELLVNGTVPIDPMPWLREHAGG